MKITKTSLERTFNLGNYESLRVGFEAEVTEQDNPLDTIKGLEDMAELYLNTRHAKTEHPKPQDQPKEPSQGVVVNLDDLKWELMPATEKGTWEKSESKGVSYPFIKEAIEAKDGRPVYMEGFIVWMNDDGSLGRRKK